MKDILGLFQLTNTLIAQQIIFDRFYILNLFQEYWFWSVILIQIQSALEYGNNTDPGIRIPSGMRDEIRYRYSDMPYLKVKKMTNRENTIFFTRNRKFIFKK